MKKKKGGFTNFILIVAMVIGLSLLLYPSFSDWWNDMVQSRAIAHYEEQLANMNKADFSKYWDAARSYNRTLLDRENVYTLTDEQKEQYPSLLTVNAHGVMGYIEIPAISCYLPIYHGTSEEVLQVAIGHLDWTSLPTGGAGTHCVVSGHRGLPSAKLFTDLDKMMVGDLFMLHVLDETLTYEVDSIQIVLPDQTESLKIEADKDLVTLVTCTPYGINTHRLLVRGHRVENAKEAIVVRIVADAVQIEPLLIAAILAVPALLIVLTAVLIGDSVEAKENRHHTEEETES